MRKGTFWLSERDDGSISIGIEDYEVEVFGGGDYEWIYTLDRLNKEKMSYVLSQTLDGTLEEMITEEFGIHLDKKSMGAWFEANEIKYDFYSNLS